MVKGLFSALADPVCRKTMWCSTKPQNTVTGPRNFGVKCQRGGFSPLWPIAGANNVKKALAEPHDTILVLSVGEECGAWGAAEYRGLAAWC